MIGHPAMRVNVAVWSRPLLDDEEGEFKRVFDETGIDTETLASAFKHGKLVTLSDSDWSRLENTDSYNIVNLDEARKLAGEYDRDIESILQALGAQKDLPAPIILELEDGTLTLVGGNTRLMAARALGISPKVLWMTTKTTSTLASRVATRYLRAKGNDVQSQVEGVLGDERQDDEYDAAIVDFCDSAFRELEELNETVTACIEQFAKAAEKMSEHSHERVHELFAPKMKEALMEAARTVKGAGDGAILEIVRDLKKLRTDAGGTG